MENNGQQKTLHQIDTNIGKDEEQKEHDIEIHVGKEHGKEEKEHHDIELNICNMKERNDKRKTKDDIDLNIKKNQKQKVEATTTATTNTSKMEKYSVEKKMAEAIYGDVLLCKDASGKYVAIKRMDLKCANRKKTQDGYDTSEDAALEWKVNKVLSAHGGHQHVLRMQESFEEDNKLHLVFDYCSKGDLLGVLQEGGKAFTKRRALRYTHQILLGMEFMHQNGVAHRDLSLENVLVNDKDECEICDFGLVASIPSMCSECVGKDSYMAPEVVEMQYLGATSYDPAMADSWSLGVMLFTMLTGQLPFEEASRTDKDFKIFAKYGMQALLQKLGVGSNLSLETLDLLTTLLKINHYERSTVAEALLHPVFEGTRKEIEIMKNARAIVASLQESRVEESHTIQKPEVGNISPASKTMLTPIQCCKSKTQEANTSSSWAKSGYYASTLAEIHEEISVNNNL